MKDKEVMVANELPMATEVKKMSKPDKLVYVFVGAPNKDYQKVYGTESKVQLDDKIADASQVGEYFLLVREKKKQEFRNSLTTALKIDKSSNMGLVGDVKTELRKVNALRINYVSTKGDVFNNLK